MIKAIIFDFDGVIFNSEEPVFKLLKKVCKKYGYIIKNKQEFKELYNDNFYEAIEKKCIKGRKLENFKKESIEELQKLHLRLFHNIPEMLEELNKHYYLAVISSNFKKIMEDNLKKKRLFGFFSAVVGADQIESKVEKIRKCLDLFNVKPSETVYVTDTTGDIKEAKKAKVKTLAVTWGFHPRAMLKKEKPNFIINRPKQILKVLK